MTRRVFPDSADRLAYQLGPDNRLWTAASLTAVVYDALTGPDLADVRTEPGGDLIPDSELEVDATSGLPDFQGPDDDREWVYVSVNGGPRYPVRSRVSDRVQELADQVEAVVGDTETALAGKQATLPVGTTSQFLRGDQTFVTVTKATVGLGSIDNTADSAKPVSAPQQTALDARAPDVQTFTSNGTWAKPPGALLVQITAIGGGGGGGSGRRGATGTACSGGGGGGGGAIINVTLPASALSATVAVTVAGGGAGGAAVTADDSNGLPGASGGHSAVAGAVIAYGGVGGGGGTTSSGPAGASLTNASANGAVGSTTVGGNGVNPLNAGFGGVGGGGVSAANAAANGGAQGWNPYVSGVVIGPAGTTAGAPAGSGSNVPDGLPLPGGGAGGGAGSISGPGGAGGNGGLYGSAGSGGGASRNGNASGKGGDGAPGIVQIITYR